ncbi:hypothetical protein [Alteromonas sp. 5E99-2]|uniref:hypothetical protein n=1 Tax=Alteromonas sp. 5E99-2 TaxID=2817683 RepID=UPI001A99D7C4|nr:hypothetical protein [Alteromonas sp. 5E99-2]
MLAVLVIAIVLTVLVSSAARLLETRIALAQSAKDRAADIAQVHGKSQELLYYVATGRRTFAGISTGANEQGNLRSSDGDFINITTGDELREDGFVYKEDNGLGYSLQNTAGLLPLNSSFPYWLTKWLEQKSVSYANQSALIQGVADWADEDDWRRPAGAEASLYTKNSLTAPTNYLFQHCGELNKVLAWRNQPALIDAFLPYCTVRRTSNLSLNSIPLSLWALLFPNSAVKIASERAQANWLTTRNVAINIEPSLRTISEDYYSLLGGDSTIISVENNSEAIRFEVEVNKGQLPPYTLRAR